MRSLWAVARQTFSQCLRTRVAVAFGVLLAASLALLPSFMEGDGTLAGRIRAFLDYSTSAIALLLSLAVVLLAVDVVSGDVRGKYIFITATKPLARWQYVLGRWLGVVLLAATLLAPATAAVYLTAQYLRGWTELAERPEDRRAVETEVFAARTRISAEAPDVTQLLPGRIRRQKTDGTWQTSLDQYKARLGLSEAEAEQKMVEDLRKLMMAEVQSVAPGRWLTWNFTGIGVRPEGREAEGLIRQLLPKAGVLAVEVDEDFISRLLAFGPVWINDVGGQVIGAWPRGFRVRMPLEDMKDPRLAGLREGSQVRARAESTIQISYKIAAADPTGGKALQAAWRVENPTTGYAYNVPPQEASSRQQATVIVPSRAVDANGAMRVQFYNFSPVSVTVLSSEVGVTCPAGTFEANLLKTAGLILVGLMFLAALGVFAGTFLSLPVACLLAMTMLAVGSGFRFLSEAVESGIKYPGPGDPVAFYHVAGAMLWAVKVVMPDLASTLSTDFLVQGIRITWRYLGETSLLTLVVRTGALLALACWVFHRRELARVQV